MGYKITPKELEHFYENVDKLCSEIFDVGTIFYDFAPEMPEDAKEHCKELVLEEKFK